MPDFCSDNTETITDTNYSDNYQTATRTSCLPNGGRGFEVDERGMVDGRLLGSHLQTLITRTNASVPDINMADSNMNPAEDYAKNAATLRKDIMTEYCFYYKRYMYILRDILMIAATTSNLSNNSAYNDKKTNTAKLNSKLNQILQILQSLVNSRINSLKGYYGEETGVNKLNKELNETREQLIKHSSLMKKATMEKDAKAAMIEYSIEKNSSSRNLLAIYGFMNIVAAGLLFYLYRSAKAE